MWFLIKIGIPIRGSGRVDGRKERIGRKDRPSRRRLPSLFASFVRWLPLLKPTVSLLRSSFEPSVRLRSVIGLRLDHTHTHTHTRARALMRLCARRPTIYRRKKVLSTNGDDRLSESLEARSDLGVLYYEVNT